MKMLTLSISSRTLILIFLHSHIMEVCCDGCDEGDIRLVSDQTTFEGKVEMCSEGVWVTVCGDELDNRGVCRQLGLPLSTGFDGGNALPMVFFNVDCKNCSSITNNCQQYADVHCRSSLLNITFVTATATSVVMDCRVSTETRPNSYDIIITYSDNTPPGINYTIIIEPPGTVTELQYQPLSPNHQYNICVVGVYGLQTASACQSFRTPESTQATALTGGILGFIIIILILLLVMAGIGLACPCCRSKNKDLSSSLPMDLRDSPASAVQSEVSSSQIDVEINDPYYEPVQRTPAVRSHVTKASGRVKKAKKATAHLPIASVTDIEVDDPNYEPVQNTPSISAVSSHVTTISSHVTTASSHDLITASIRAKKAGVHLKPPIPPVHERAATLHVKPVVPVKPVSGRKKAASLFKKAPATPVKPTRGRVSRNYVAPHSYENYELPGSAYSN